MLFYKIEVKSIFGGTLTLFTKLFLNIFSNLSIKILKMPKCIKKYAVLKSPHIYKKSMEHFESRYSKVVFFLCLPLEKESVFFKKFKTISWSFLGVSVKHTRIEKQCFYLKQKDSNL